MNIHRLIKPTIYKYCKNICKQYRTRVHMLHYSRHGVKMVKIINNIYKKSIPS